jgi:RimJ/RimL family protein N-acetyltransferase
MIIGKKISLRALEKDDLIQLQMWRNNEEFRKHFREYRDLSLNDQKKWFDDFVISDEKTLMFGIVENMTKELIGVCGLCCINYIHRHADLSLYIGKDNIYIDPEPEGVAWGTMQVLFEYAFDRLNLHKIWCEIYEFDEKKHQLFDKYGMHIDAELRDNYFYNGEYQNSHIYSMLEDEWRANK